MRRPCLTTLVLALVASLAACGGSGGSEPVQPPAPTSGSLLLTIGGLPGDVPASVTVTGPGGFSRTVTTSATLTDLTPGTYTVTPSRATDRGVGYEAAASNATVTAGATASASAAYALRLLTRATTNRADETTLPHVKLLYILPSDGADRAFDTNGTIHRVVSSGQRWLAGQAGGRSLRYDAADGGLDVAFVRAPRSDATYAGYGVFIRDSLEKDLNAAGWNLPNTRLLAFYDGRHQSVCGSSAQPGVLDGNLAVLYLNGLPTSSAPCAGNAFVASPTGAPGYWEFVAQHEVFHLLGFVSPGAPNAVAGGHVGNDPTDLMYAGALPWRPAKVDVSGTNYYNPNGLASGLNNFATSPFVVAP